MNEQERRAAVDRLEALIKELGGRAEAYEAGLREIIMYVSSDKFEEWPYVNTQDIITRCYEALSK